MPRMFPGQNFLPARRRPCMSLYLTFHLPVYVHLKLLFLPVRYTSPSQSLSPDGLVQTEVCQAGRSLIPAEGSATHTPSVHKYHTFFCIPHSKSGNRKTYQNKPGQQFLSPERFHILPLPCGYKGQVQTHASFLPLLSGQKTSFCLLETLFCNWYTPHPLWKTVLPAVWMLHPFRSFHKILALSSIFPSLFRIYFFDCPLFIQMLQ